MICNFFDLSVKKEGIYINIQEQESGNNFFFFFFSRKCSNFFSTSIIFPKISISQIHIGIRNTCF